MRGDMVRSEERGGTKEASGEATPSEVARLLIADDHALVREGLRTMLSGEEGLHVVAEANDGQEALSYCRKLRPDLVLMDVRMPVMDGLEATRRIKQEMPQTSVVMVTMHENPDYLFEAVKAGAAGYVLKDASGERLLGAVRRTLEGESPLNQELAMRLLVRLARERREGAPGGDTSGADEGTTERSGETHRASGAAREGDGRGDRGGHEPVSHPSPPGFVGLRMCPGNEESAGKRRSGKTRKGSKWLRSALTESARAAARAKGTYLAAHYARLRGRRGSKKAAVAVGHSISGDLLPRAGAASAL